MIRIDKTSLSITLSIVFVSAIGVLGGAYLARTFLPSWDQWIGTIVVALSFSFPYPPLIYFIMRQKSEFNSKVVIASLLFSSFIESFFFQLVFQMLMT